MDFICEDSKISGHEASVFSVGTKASDIWIVMGRQKFLGDPLFESGFSQDPS
jgi:hypothetical protein